MTKKKALFIGIVSVALVCLGLTLTVAASRNRPAEFDASKALEDVAYQMSLGPRVPDTEAHDAVIRWMVKGLQAFGWNVTVQESQSLGHTVRNVVAKRGSGSPWYVVGAHYDSRLLADQDSDADGRLQPVPGADDGASGVAVLMELARILPERLNGQVWLVMFDAEDSGDIAGWDWLLGSRAFASSLIAEPDGVIVLDMIGDADLQIYQEANSDPVLRASIWEQAAELGYGKVFIDSVKYSMYDDHSPFLEKGIPAVDVIDFDYPYWHTQEDTLNKISAGSLKAVGDTMLAWLLSR